MPDTAPASNCGTQWTVGARQGITSDPTEVQRHGGQEATHIEQGDVQKHRWRLRLRANVRGGKQLYRQHERAHAAASVCLVERCAGVVVHTEHKGHLYAPC